MSDEQPRDLDDLKARVSPLGAPTVADWLEVRVTGDPGNGYPPYDFTFRSDREAWQHAAQIAARAFGEWGNPTMQLRRVHVETSTSEWADLSPESFA